jgi:hypothetical protein
MFKMRVFSVEALREAPCMSDYFTPFEHDPKQKIGWINPLNRGHPTDYV